MGVEDQGEVVYPSYLGGGGVWTTIPVHSLVYTTTSLPPLRENQGATPLSLGRGGVGATLRECPSWRVGESWVQGRSRGERSTFLSPSPSTSGESISVSLFRECPDNRVLD